MFGLITSKGFCQDLPAEAEQKLENLTDTDEGETEDDSWLLQMEHFRKNPLNLNVAGKDELRELRILTDLQIENFLIYRKLLGNLVSIYELQAIPSWDVITIKKLLPFITVAGAVTMYGDMKNRFKNGNHSLLFRISQVLEKSTGYTPKPTGNYYLGSPQRIFFRYRYQYKNILQYGLVGDKDAGEQFFKSKQKYGFDFYSFHLFARKIGAIQSLAIGDFTVNMGQGLIQWQSLAFKKSADVTGIKRQSAVLRPYNSAGEFNFQRGIGITVKKGNVEVTAFGSVRKLSVNLITDTLDYNDYFSSFLTSGYHRSQGEMEDRNNMQQLAFGGNVSWNKNRLHIAVNGIKYHFSAPLQKRAEPYNLFAITGNNWGNYSTDYSYTFKNFHFFGEAAIDKNFNKAFVNGLLISVDQRVDLSLLYRSINKEYQAVNGNAFTENTFPSNESGTYAGISIRPTASLQLNAYADIYSFPWLKYLVDAPSFGRDFLIQLMYTPDKKTEFYSRYRNETKQGNTSGNNGVTNYLSLIPRQSWRTQLSYMINKAITLRTRFELLWYDKKGDDKENGFLTFLDCIYKPLLSRIAGSVRVQYFETGGYNSRMYAYENDLLYNYSIPQFFDKGFRYYLNVKYDFGNRVSCWLKWSQTLYNGKLLIGSGLDEIEGKHKSEAKFQFIINL